MPATSSTPGSQPQAVARKNTKTAAKSLARSVAPTVSTGAAVGRAVQQVATQTGRAVSAGTSYPTASSSTAALKKRRAAKRQRKVDHALKKLIKSSSEPKDVLNRSQNKLWKSLSDHERQRAVERADNKGLYQQELNTNKPKAVRRKVAQQIAIPIQGPQKIKSLYRKSGLPGKAPKTEFNAKTGSGRASGEKFKAAATVDADGMHLSRKASRSLVKTGKPKQRNRVLLLHEFAHTQQSSGMPQAVAEGGADLFAKRKAKELGIPKASVQAAMTPPYKPFRKAVRKQTNRNFQLYGQFADAGSNTLGETRARNARASVHRDPAPKPKTKKTVNTVAETFARGKAKADRAKAKKTVQKVRPSLRSIAADVGKGHVKEVQKRHAITKKLTKAVEKSQPQVNTKAIPKMNLSHEVAPTVKKLAEERGLPASVLMAQLENESGFNPLATEEGGSVSNTPSEKQGGGISQFITSTAKTYGVQYGDSPAAVKSQLRGQADYMADLVKSHGSIEGALGAYYGDGATGPGTYSGNIMAASARYAALDQPGGKGKPIPASLKAKATDVLGPDATKAIIKGARTAPSGKPVPKKTVTRYQAILDEAKKIDSATLPYSLGAAHVAGRVPGPKKTGAYDCSSAVSRVLQAAGVKLPGALVSGDLATTPLLKDGPGAVTIYANAEHVFMKIGDQYWGTSHANPGGGAGFIPTSYEEGEATSGAYTVRHVPGLGTEIARRMGIRLSGVGASPGMSVSASGTSATITDGVVQNTPGASNRPIKLDPKSRRRVTRRRKARKQLTRSLRSNAPAALDPADYLIDPSVESYADSVKSAPTRVSV